LSFELPLEPNTGKLQLVLVTPLQATTPKTGQDQIRLQPDELLLFMDERRKRKDDSYLLLIETGRAAIVTVYLRTFP
jgi:hypothetical protein